MRKIIKIPIDEVRLSRNDILKTQGIPRGKNPSKTIEPLFNKAIELFLECSKPSGIVSEISIPEFGDVYKGEGLNEESTPLDEIFRKAEALALFAVTIGERVNQKMAQLFKENELVLGSMLDGAASVGTDKAADMVEDYYFNMLSKKGATTNSTPILRYSPGYCGWHMSGQKKLFEFLKPKDIGISLMDSYLMKPLKSISGVLVAGPKEIHKFKDSYPFCIQCKTHSCRERIRALFKESKPKT